jgi:hypothetical protein
MKPTLFLLAVLGLGTAAIAQEMHHEGVNQRGDQVMGFSHEKTTHHFRLYKNGGAVEVTANDAKDAASRDQIQMHLSHIAGMFAAGNFQAPMLVHAAEPPGVPVLQRLKGDVAYRFEKTERGGTVRITTKNEEALAAVHEFLRFQITDHKTGDRLDVK